MCFVLNCTLEIPDTFQQHSQLTAWYCPLCPWTQQVLKLIKFCLTCQARLFCPAHKSWNTCLVSSYQWLLETLTRESFSGGWWIVFRKNSRKRWGLIYNPSSCWYGCFVSGADSQWRAPGQFHCQADSLIRWATTTVRFTDPKVGNEQWRSGAPDWFRSGNKRFGTQRGEDDKWRPSQRPTHWGAS